MVALLMFALTAVSEVPDPSDASEGWPMGTCVETTTPTTPGGGDLARSEACAALGASDDCSIETIERFEAAGYVRRLWVLPRASAEGQAIWQSVPQPKRVVDGQAGSTDHLWLGAEVGEDALVADEPVARPVACGVLRPRWVTRAPVVWWVNEELWVATRISTKREQSDAAARDLALKQVDQLEIPLRPKKKTSHFLKLGLRGHPLWYSPDGRRVALREQLSEPNAKTLRSLGWWQKDEEPPPKKLPAHIDRLLAKSPILEKILRAQGDAESESEVMAHYRIEGDRFRYVLAKTDYTDVVLSLEEPTRTRVREALRGSETRP